MYVCVRVCILVYVRLCMCMCICNLAFCKLELCSFVILRSVEWQFSADVAGQLIDPEMSVRNCHSMLRKIPKERRSRLQTTLFALP